MSAISLSKSPTELSGIINQWKNVPPSRSTMGRLFETNNFNDATAMLRVWNNSQIGESQIWPPSQRIHVSLCGFGTLSYFAPYVSWAALADGAVAQVTIGSYNQLFQDLAVPDSTVTDKSVEMIWIWAELSDLLSTKLFANKNRLLSQEGLQAIDDAVDMLISSISVARKKSKAFIIVNEFLPMQRSPFGIADGSNGTSFEEIYYHANQKLRDRLQEIPYAGIFPLGFFARRFGLFRAVDPRLRLLADCPFSQEFFFELAKGIRPYFRALKGAVRKVLVLDLDNTLWGGIVGEDGWNGIHIGTDPLGKAFANFQSAILELYDRGVILAVNSKNNPEDVLEVFSRRDEMVLKPNHFASMQINWQDKASNCRILAKEINVGLDSLVLWDDNPAERTFVREVLEDVYVVEPPTDPSMWAGFLRDIDLFDTLKITEEDARRGQMYAEDRLRRHAEAAAPDFVSFLKSLDLKIKCRPASEENISRIVSLLARTNQFNLSTKRHSEQNIREWMNNSEWKIMTYAVDDRFGNYGIVGLTMIKYSSEYAELDSFLLSCRAMGKGIENVMLAIAAQQTQKMGLEKLVATFIPSKKNAPAKTFFSNHHFSEIGCSEGGIQYQINIKDNALPIPEYVTLEY